MKPAHLEVVVLVDTREQEPLVFPVARPATLATGDYSTPGLENVVAVERKSLPDLFACCGHGRERFRAQVERLAALRSGHLLVEGSIDDVLNAPLLGHVKSDMDPRAVLQTLLSWCTELRVPCWFAGSRQNAAAIVLGVLRHALRHFGPVPTKAGGTR